MYYKRLINPFSKICSKLKVQSVLQMNRCERVESFYMTKRRHYGQLPKSNKCDVPFVSIVKNSKAIITYNNEQCNKVLEEMDICA